MVFPPYTWKENLTTLPESGQVSFDRSGYNLTVEGHCPFLVLATISPTTVYPCYVVVTQGAEDGNVLY